MCSGCKIQILFCSNRGQSVILLSSLCCKWINSFPWFHCSAYCCCWTFWKSMPGVLSMQPTYIYCNIMSLCMMENDIQYQKACFVNVGIIWQYQSLWATVQRNEELDLILQMNTWRDVGVLQQQKVNLILKSCSKKSCVKYLNSDCLC